MIVWVKTKVKILMIRNFHGFLVGDYHYCSLCSVPVADGGEAG